MFRSGYVAVVGLPNVGKSTLLNKIIGEKVSIVTRKPQTTRHSIIGILNRPEAQILFLDTPGFHESDNMLNERMLKASLASLEDADLICHLIFPRIPLSEIDQKITLRAKELKKPYLVVINQVDTVTKETLLPIIEAAHADWSPQDIIPISALQGDGCDLLVRWIQDHLPEGPAYFPQDQYTSQTTRFLCAEIVREKAMKWLHQEIPYGLITQVEKFEEKER
ncbi:MAG: GTPase Era, partial [bacterium]|nr:GTPase Era [bacterium]